jgi:hypothetical protein
MVLGVLVVAGLPVLVLGGQAGHDAGPASPSGSPAATPAPAVESPPIGGDLAVSAKEAARTYRQDQGAEPVAPANFECKAVRRDDSVDSDQYPVPLPPFSTDVFPCTRCHDKPNDFNTTKRNLTLEHLNIKLVHGPREQWCYGCHNPTNRDVLRLAGGRTVTFLRSYELCGQCHGPKYRDWRLGIHGRRTGCWNGKREYLLCVHCHNPHSPKFKPLEPMPRPKRPTEIRPGGE